MTRVGTAKANRQIGERFLIASRIAAGIALCASLVACSALRSDPPVPVAEAPAAEPAASSAAPTEANEPQGGEIPAVEPLGSPGRTDGCAAGMVRVEGDYCPAVVQECLEEHPDYVKHKGEAGVAERCLRYAPSKCVSKERVHVSFCMDRYEYPNVPGEMPRVLTSWEDASAMCAAEGKRLCTEPEFNFACEGPEMLPYVYGYERNAALCNQDQDYRMPDLSRQMLHYESCMADPTCAAELARLDQREAIGERSTCVSWAGVYDLNGNVNEWVVRPGEHAPTRSGLKGGWWGPIRSRCRAVTTFHKEDDYGYEVGFRCCANAGN